MTLYAYLYLPPKGEYAIVEDALLAPFIGTGNMQEYDKELASRQGFLTPLTGYDRRDSLLEYLDKGVSVIEFMEYQLPGHPNERETDHIYYYAENGHVHWYSNPGRWLWNGGWVSRQREIDCDKIQYPIVEVRGKLWFAVQYDLSLYQKNQESLDE